VNDDQAEKLLRELRAIKLALWTAILAAAVLYLGTRIVAVAFEPPPVVSHQPPK